MKVNNGTSDTGQSFVLLYPDTNQEMAEMEVALNRFNETDEPIKFCKEISDNQRVLAYKFFIGRKKGK